MKPTALMLASLFLLSLPAAISTAALPDSERLVALHEPDSPFIAFNFYIKAGSQCDPKGKEGLAALTAAVISEGSTEEDRYEQILEKLYPMAAGYDYNVDKEMTVFTGRTHKDNLAGYYTLFKNAVLKPGFREEDFVRIKSRTMNYLRQARRYSNDEELSKELLFREIYRGTPYEHPEEGYVQSVESIVLDDVKQFYAKHYGRNNIVVGLGGGFPGDLPAKVRKDVDSLPEVSPESIPAPRPAAPSGIRILLVEKDTRSTPISFGYPIPVLRSSPDFHALMLANSWMGEHRNSFSNLYQVIREKRGMNYGDYSYIEAYPAGYATQVPPTNVSRRSQIFEVWIRPVSLTVPGTLHDRALFAFRAALRELKALAEQGMTEREFERTRQFLKNYTVNFGSTISRRLAYRIDDLFHGIPAPGFLAGLRDRLTRLKLQEVNSAIRSHLQSNNLQVVFITRDAEGMKKKLLEGTATPITYPGDKPAAIREEDKVIASFPIPVKAADISIIHINDVFEK